MGRRARARAVRRQLPGVHVGRARARASTRSAGCCTSAMTRARRQLHLLRPGALLPPAARDRRRARLRQAVALPDRRGAADVRAWSDPTNGCAAALATRAARRGRSACRSTRCFGDGHAPGGRHARRGDRRRRPQRARRGGACSRAPGALCSCSSAATQLGGAAVSAAPFPGVDVRLSRYAYLVSLFPASLARTLGLDVELRRRPGRFVHPVRRPGLLVDRDDAVTRASMRADGRSRRLRRLAALLRAIAAVAPGCSRR